jgi:hypothetical protein
MSISKVFWTGAASGALLMGASLGVVWYATSQPKCAVTRALEGATHASAHISPVSGLAPVLARAEHSSSLAHNETDLNQGLPDDPTPDGNEAAPMGDVSNTGETSPIVIPETKPAPPMPPAEEMEMHTLHTPRLLDECGEEAEPACGLFEMVRGLLQGLFAQPPVMAPVEEPMPFPEAELPAKPEMREDPHRDHHPGCPALHGCPPRQYVPTPEMQPSKDEPQELPGMSAALEALKDLLLRGPLEAQPLHPDLRTLELRESDMLRQDPGAL